MKATERISDVLALFTATAPEQTTGGVAQSCGIANSTAHDLLNGLADVGLLKRQAPGRFRLGPRVAQLAETLHSADTLIEAARPVVVKTSENYGETCHLVVQSDARLISMTSSEGRGLVRVARTAIGAGTPIYAVAAGKVLMAAMPFAELNRMLPGLEQKAYTPATVLQKSILRDQIADIRAAGYAEEEGEFDVHMASNAAPVRNHSGTVVGALTLLVPVSRFSEERRAYRNICIEAAKQISVRLGWSEEISPEEWRQANAR